MDTGTERLKEEQIRIAGLFDRNIYTGIFFTIAIAVKICHKNYPAMLIMALLVIYTLWLRWKEGRLDEIININFFSMIFLAGTIVYFYHETGSNQAAEITAGIYAVTYGPFAFCEFMHFIKSIRNRPD